AGRLHLDHDIVGIRARIGKLHQFQLTIAMKHHPAHRLPPEFSLFLPDLERKMWFRKGRTFEPSSATYNQGVSWKNQRSRRGLVRDLAHRTSRRFLLVSRRT